ncbi:MAG: hypothetical protein RR549_03980 [Oscillospiraceae bacterium]
MDSILNKDGFLTYKERPLVRNNDIIYYGSMTEDFVVMIRIISKQKQNDFEIADKLLVQLMNTNPDVDATEKIVKKSEKQSLYSALEIADIWLSRKL